MNTSFCQSLLPVVVLYRQTIEDSLTLDSLDRNMAGTGLRLRVFVYDNSPEQQYTRESFEWKSLDIQYFHDPENSGLSRAYNTGARKADQLQKRWLLLLDQDTTFPSTFLKDMEITVKAHPERQLFAPVLKLKDGSIFSPCIAKHKRGYPPAVITPGEASLWQFSPVNSGMLVSLELFRKSGGYNEKVKVDFCDFQFLEKVRRIEDRFIIADTSGLQDFSGFEKSSGKQKARFLRYLEDASNCEKPTFADKAGFLYTVSRHALGLSIKLKDFSFIRMFVRQYLIR